MTFDDMLTQCVHEALKEVYDEFHYTKDDDDRQLELPLKDHE